VKNVVGVLEGVGPLANETVVIGAHYDHVGRGGPDSGAIDPNSKEIHNGADDNASGTATLIEVARQIVQAESKPRRRIVFIAFTGEERGLFGSDYYTKHPLFKLEDTVAMLNMDMVGRLDEDKLIIEGVDTAAEFEPLVESANRRQAFKITKKSGGSGPSDHASFYPMKVPVMHFFTGTHGDYHRPSDDFEKLSLSGMRRVGEMVAEVALNLAQDSQRPTYKEVAAPVRGGGDRPYFGSVPDFSSDQPGYALKSVTSGSPAEKAGIQGGDVIIKLGESRIGNLDDFDSALRKFTGGDRVPIVVRRDGQDVTLQVTLGEPRG
jgi:Zn-dependent M28 family amino/carboxypeptidase